MILAIPLHLLHLLLDQQMMLQTVIVVRMKTIEVVIVKLMMQRRRMVRMKMMVIVVAVGIRITVMMRWSARPAHIFRHAGIYFEYNHFL